MSAQLHLSLSGNGERRGMYPLGRNGSPDMTWTPFFESMADIGSDSKAFDLNACSALESLQLDDLIGNEITSPSSSAASDNHRNPISSLHTLPAWSTSRDAWENKTSPAYSDDRDDEDTVNDVWFAPTTTSPRKKRIAFAYSALQEHDREVSPGVASSTLKSHKSAPQLLPQQRISSADHQAKLEDLLVEMGWPRESITDAVDTHDGGETHEATGSSSHTSSMQGTGIGSALAPSNPSPSTGAGSLASGMPVTSALFRRRASLRDGAPMPNPAQVVVPTNEEVNRAMKAPITSVPSLQMDHSLHADIDYSQHSRSATLPASHDPFSSISSAEQLMAPLAFSDTSFAHFSLLPYAAQGRDNRMARAVQQAALVYGNGPRRSSQSAQQTHSHFESGPSPSGGRRPESVSSGSFSGTELQTPLTPFQNLNSADVNSVPLPFSYPISPANFSSHPLMSGLPAGNFPAKLKSESQLDSGTLGNSLGLHYMTPQEPNQPSMIDSSSYSQIFASMPSMNGNHLSVQQQQRGHALPNLKQMRSSPNMRSSPPSAEGLPEKAKLRKIASNRRLAASAAENVSSMPLTIPKSPSKKGKNSNMILTGASTLPHTSSLSSSPRKGGTGLVTSFEFVNYGMDDADELCSAVAPSGSYKIPLKGFGGERDEEGNEEEDDDEGEPQQEQGRMKSSSVTSSNSNSNRPGPRWQRVEEGDGTDDDRESTSTANKSPRKIKRIRSEVNMKTLSPGRRKTASNGNLRRG